MMLSSHLTIIAFHFMYGFGRLQQRKVCVFNQFYPYGNIVEKGGAGGLKGVLHLQGPDSYDLS